MTSYPRVLACALLLALSSAGLATTSAAAAPAVTVEDPSPSPSPTDSGDPLSAQIADTTGQLQTDLTQMRSAQTSAEERYAEAVAKARQLQRVVARNQAAADQARKIVGQYARSIYMNGSTDLSVLASMIDPADPSDMVNRADDALRVGDHKDLEYDRALQVLKRNQEIQAQAEAAQSAAQASLQSIENQMNGLRHQLADVAGRWADHLAGLTNTIDTAQAKRNSDAAAQWAEYLGQLADRKVPSVTEADLRVARLPKGIRASHRNPGIAHFGRGADSLIVLPERVMAAVTYAVSTLGTPYKWRANSGSAMDCSSLLDRAWNIPAIPRAKRTDTRPLVSGGVSAQAQHIQLVPTGKLSPGDVVFLSDPRRGVDHAGIALDSDTMIAADANTGGVNAVPIPSRRVWQIGRLSLRTPRNGNYVPKATKRPFQCGADPAGFIMMPDGKILANPSLCPPNPAVFGEAHMQQSAILVGRCAAALWPAIKIIGGWRPSDPYPDHPSGRATDIMMPQGCSETPEELALGTSIATFFMKNAAKFNVQYIIWQQRVWMATEQARPPALWRGMSDRGSCTANHRDHVHISVNGPDVAPGVTDTAPPPDPTPTPTPTRNRHRDRTPSEGGTVPRPDRSGSGGGNGSGTQRPAP